MKNEHTFPQSDTTSNIPIE